MAPICAVSKVRMGKKVDKAVREKPVTPVEEEGPKTAEDYICTGNLEADFIEICTRLEMVEMPIVTVRHPGISASGVFDEMESLTPSDVSSAPPTKDQISFFRPSIQVEIENDDPKLVKSVYIRGWMIDPRYVFIFQKCLPALTYLHTINLWNVGLNETTFTAFVSVLRQCANLKTVVLDGNPIPGHPYHQLLSEESQFQHLTLRNNLIDDEGAKLIAEALSTIKKSNKTVLSINLSFNHITDIGAVHIAKGLRLNRTLLWLCLAYNEIGDTGAIKLAEVIAPFPLTHEEVVERRILLMDSVERQRSPTSFKRPESKSDRSTSQMGSSTNIDKLDKSAKSGRVFTKKKDKKEVAIPDRQISSSTQLPAKKEETRMAKRGSIIPDTRSSKTKLRSGKRGATQELEVSEPLNPLIDFVEHRDGSVYLSGNSCLMSLNLTHNKITGTGLKGFLSAVKIQIQYGKLSPDGRSASGLLRLPITKNAFSLTCGTYTQLQELMLARDPISKQHVVCSPSHTADDK